MLGRIKLYAAAGLAFIAGLVGIYWRGKSDGAEAERDEHTRRRVDAMKQAKDVRDEIMDDPYLVDRANQWVRTNDKR
jgi:hypothetical protein